MDPPGASLPVTSTPVEPPAVLVALIYEITTLRDSPALTHFWENFNLVRGRNVSRPYMHIHEPSDGSIADSYLG